VYDKATLHSSVGAVAPSSTKSADLEHNVKNVVPISSSKGRLNRILAMGKEGMVVVVTGGAVGCYIRPGLP